MEMIRIPDTTFLGASSDPSRFTFAIFVLLSIYEVYDGIYTPMIAYYKKFVNPFLRKFKRGIKSIAGKRILILGFGREGQDTLRFLQAHFPELVLGIADKNPDINLHDLKFKIQNAKCKMTKKIIPHFGENYLEAIKKYDVIIKSPGIPPKLISPYLNRGQVVTSATEIFFDLCPSIIVGVTGTKGKSTTAAMIYHILKNRMENHKEDHMINYKVFLVGNIGKPALSLLGQSIVGSDPTMPIFVYELSSHQLFGLKKSPHIAVFLNIYPEHLDYYKNFNEYARAKANICLHQKKGDYLIYNAGDKLVNKFAKKSKAEKIPVSGSYYKLDKAAAIAVAKIFGISARDAVKTLKSFKFLPHRLEKVGTFRGITFYNDSLSTIPQTTIEALNALGGKVETLIAGGFDRGVSFNGLAKKIVESNIGTLILFPPSGQRILGAIDKIQNAKCKMQNSKFKMQSAKCKMQNDKEKCKIIKKERIAYFFVTSMKDAIRLAFKHTNKGKICLLSPASPSFGIFKDYKDRGEQFKYYARRL